MLQLTLEDQYSLKNFIWVCRDAYILEGGSDLMSRAGLQNEAEKFGMQINELFSAQLNNKKLTA